MNLKKIALGIGILSQLYGLGLANDNYDITKSTGDVRRSRVYYAELRNLEKNLEDIAEEPKYNILRTSETMTTARDYSPSFDSSYELTYKK